MLDLIQTIRAWQRDGHVVTLATLVGVENSAPRDPGASFAVCDDGRLAGSISGGCVEAALVEESTAVRRDGVARIVRYGLSDADALAVGLTCGGTLRILVERLDETFCAALQERDGLVALATRIDPSDAGRRLAIFEDRLVGTLGTPELDAAVSQEARDGNALPETHGAVEIFLERVCARPEMYVFGAIDFAQAMVRIGRAIGFHVTLCDARAAFATVQRFPDAHRVVVAWPHEFLAGAPVDERSAIVALTHDEKFDIPLLLAALRTRAGYVGAMGSRATNARRLELLTQAGATPDELARLCAPIGLDIGARTPEETAIAIAAEIVAQRHGRPGGRLTGGAGPLRGHLSC
ncbi:MAG TPA: XdhC family protein [Verrucomicrobiae bacterium]|nr:XdhC family protein [Verrucomicrobiae bacterium]